MSTKPATSASNSTSRYRHREAVSYSIPGPRLLVVQDHKKTGQALARELEAMGYVSDISGTAAQARAALETGDYVALVLDLDLQGGDGLKVLREIRQREDPIAVIAISARNSVNDRINVLRSGADDCLAKTFSYGELVARLETVLRRYDHRFAPLQVANLVFDPVSRRTFVDQRLQKLSRRQTAVLRLLVRRQGRVLPKVLIERELFGRKSSSTSNAVDVYVHRLRKRLAESGAKVQVRAIRGIGYVMSDESSRRLMNLTFDTSHPQAFIDRWLQILSAREAKVLELLTRKPGSIVPKKLLERQLFGRDDSSTANALEVFIHRLRKKLIERGVNVQIRTVVGAGYRIVEQDRHGRC